ncbi:hypothetical protein P7B02_11425 [Caulobacter segnis]|uniref:hypothetical protein n=1 Tax=Caulobacter segnis TaxID=88688 RepID=UPI00240EE6E8|nr:hypothetical protein [Caulobacter segnis]MDG2522151.1 hypothetical protein [Caulobacter segnis]
MPVDRLDPRALMDAMQVTTLDFAPDGQSRWAGMGDYILRSPDGGHEIALRYLGEPPHGDSYHELQVDGVKLPGYAWVCNFAFTPDSKFLAANWMAECYERRTVVIDVHERRFAVLPEHLVNFAFSEEQLVGIGESVGSSFSIAAVGEWTRF